MSRKCKSSKVSATLQPAYKEILREAKEKNKTTYAALIRTALYNTYGIAGEKIGK